MGCYYDLCKLPYIFNNRYTTRIPAVPTRYVQGNRLIHELMSIQEVDTIDNYRIYTIPLMTRSQGYPCGLKPHPVPFSPQISICPFSPFPLFPIGTTSFPYVQKGSLYTIFCSSAHVTLTAALQRIHVVLAVAAVYFKAF